MKLTKDNLLSAVWYTKRYVDSGIFEKPFVMLTYEDYTSVYSDFYSLVNGEYGLKATFFLNNATKLYALDEYLTRSQYNEMINAGWDIGLRTWIGDLGDVTQASTDDITKALNALVDQKEAIGIFNSVMYLPDYTFKFITPSRRAGFKLIADTISSSDNYLKGAQQTVTGRVDITNNSSSYIMDRVDTCIANNWGMVINIQKLLDSNRAKVVEILDGISNRVSSNDLEVLTAYSYLAKYRPDLCIPNDNNRHFKEFNYIMNKVNG